VGYDATSLGNRFLITSQNVGNRLPSDVASYPTRRKPSL